MLDEASKLILQNNLPFIVLSSEAKHHSFSIIQQNNQFLKTLKTIGSQEQTISICKNYIKKKKKPTKVWENVKRTAGGRSYS